MRMIEKMVLALMPQLGYVLLRGKGGGGGGQQQSTTESKLDPEVKEKWITMYGKAEDIAADPYKGYGGDMLAGFTPEQKQSFAAYQSGIGTGAPALNQAVNTMTGLTGATPNNIQAHTVGNTLQDYLNPYTDQVINQSIIGMDKGRQLAMNQMASDATAAGAFGGSRHGVAEAETNKNYFDSLSSMISKQKQAGYGQAMEQYMSDLGQLTDVDTLNQQAQLKGMGMQGQAAQLLAGLSGQQRDQTFGDAQVLGDIGAEQQSMNQAEMDLAYQQFLEELNYPKDQLTTLQSAFGQTPLQGMTTTTTTQS